MGTESRLPSYLITLMVPIVVFGMMGMHLIILLNYIAENNITPCQIDPETYKPTERYPTVEENIEACLEAFEQTKQQATIFPMLIGLMIGIIRTVMLHKQYQYEDDDTRPTLPKGFD
jgi:hypothetical protein